MELEDQETGEKVYKGSGTNPAVKRVHTIDVQQKSDGTCFRKNFSIMIFF